MTIKLCTHAKLNCFFQNTTICIKWLICHKPKQSTDIFRVFQLKTFPLFFAVKKQENAKRHNYSEFTMEVGIISDQQMYEFLEKEIRALTLEQKLNFLIIQWNSVSRLTKIDHVED